uniref:Glycosyltransferase 2-like domain-containing protein n=1 Tax=viral metagenome TaxID=1070528 RepID=A0A6C0KI74_9ZZZZ
MPIYNGIEFIEESVSSVLKQSFTEWELIIGINGHPPKSEIYNIAKSYEAKSNQIRAYDLIDIRGKSNALNHMLQYCKYDYVAILDVDDMWTDNKLQTQFIYCFVYDVIGSQCVYFGSMEGITPRIPLNDISDADFSLCNPMINSSVIMRKELCYWNSENDGVEDYELWLKLRKQGKRFYNCHDILVKHRIHPTSAFNTQNHSEKIKKLIEKYRST